MAHWCLDSSMHWCGITYVPRNGSLYEPQMSLVDSVRPTLQTKRLKITESPFKFKSHK